MSVTAPNLSDIATTTLRNRSKKMADNVSENTALLMRLRERGKIKPFGGGRTIVQELDYTENSTYKRYAGYELLDVSQSRVHTAAEYAIKQAAVAVTISGLEQLQNSGEEQVIDLLDARITNAERTFMNNISSDIYSDGTADGGKQIGGLQLLVADTPTSGVVGGIDRATWTFWRNQTLSITTPSASNIQTNMNTMWLRTKRNRDTVDLIVADDTFFQYYWESLQAIQRINRPDRGMAGFGSLAFMDADVVPDGGIGGDAPANHMYFLNCDYLFYRPHRDRDMEVLEPDRFATNQDAMVRLIGWAGNMTLSNAQLQGVLISA